MAMSKEAEIVLTNLGRQYVAANFPQQYGFSPDTDAEAKVYPELQARRLIKPWTADHWQFSDEGHEWVLEHCA